MLPFQIGEQEAKPEYHVVGAVLPEIEGPDGRKENILTWVASQMGTA